MKSLILLLLFTISASAQFKVEKSSDIFFPREARQFLFAQQEFPIFWWNFVVIKNASSQWPQVLEVCQKLKMQRDLTERVECQSDLAAYHGIVKDWARDLFLREPGWSVSQVKSRLRESQAHLGVVFGNSDITGILLTDPLQSWKKLRGIAESQLQIPFERREGIYFDPKTDRALIPIHFNFPPSESEKTEVIVQQLPASALLLGPHQAFYENESVVMGDVKVISALGSFVLLAFVVFLFATKRFRAALLVPPVLFAIFLASVITSLIFGAIHGLTLAFGSGIIGLTLDYGLHAGLNSQSKNTWISNTIGYLTTTAGLFILATSSIPLLRQLAVFSILGLSIGIALYYFIFKFWPRYFVIKHFDLKPRVSQVALVVLLALLLTAILGVLKLEPSLNLHRFNFEHAETRELNTWLREEMKLFPPLMQFHAHQDYLAKSQEELAWAKSAKINLQNAAVYLPPLEQQQSNIKSWNNCENFNLTSEENSLFGMYFLNCSKGQVVDAATNIPRYLSPLHGKDYSLTLWLAKNSEDDQKIRKQFPETKSLTEILLSLPATLQRELKWMVPTALLVVALIIGLYYRSLWSLVFSMLPFFTGLGLVFAVYFILGRELSFITVVGLVIVFGLSIDYGIFMSDIYRPGGEKESAPKVVTALCFAALTNLIGFAPMFFAQHPVLLDLGIPLFFGTLGSFFGAVWGIPALIGKSRGKI